MRFFKTLAGLFRSWVLKDLPKEQPMQIVNTTIAPLSQERLDWINDRRRVVNEMIRQLQTYVYSSAAGSNTTQMTAALVAAQTETVLLEVETLVISDHLAKLAEQASRIDQGELPTTSLAHR